MPVQSLLDLCGSVPDLSEDDFKPYSYCAIALAV